MAPVTRSQHDAYKTSAEWHELAQLPICDPDGWRILDEPRVYYWNVLVSFDEYRWRASRSTQRARPFWRHLFKRP